MALPPLCDLPARPPACPCGLATLQQSSSPCHRSLPCYLQLGMVIELECAPTAPHCLAQAVGQPQPR